MNVKHPGYVLGYTVLVSAAFGVLLSAFSALTERKIELNKKAKLNREVLRALAFEIPESASSEEVENFFGKHIEVRELNLPGRSTPYKVYVGFDNRAEQTNPVGYGFHIGGQGFWAPIHGIMALDPDLETIRGISFYQDDETPGLGHEINAEWFKDAFKGKKYRNPAGEIDILLTPRDKPDKVENEVDAITGASETSRAVQKFLNENLTTFQKAAEMLRAETGSA
jgi:Na+-transporting NADH:ubiquinone oxidoreductase subunit C